MRLMEPQSLQDLMLILWIVLIKLIQPRFYSGNNFHCWPSTKFNSGPIANPVFWLFQQIKQFVDRLSGNLDRLQQRPAFVSDAINAAVFTVTARIAQIVLHVSDDWVVPIEEIDGTVRTDFEIGG